MKRHSTFYQLNREKIMEKIFFNQFHLIVRWAILFALVTMLGACATNKSKSVDLGNGQSVNIGFPPESSGFYAIVENTGNQWIINKISSSTLKRTKDSQEVLFVNHSFNYVSPAFTSRGGFIDKEAGAGTDYFVCYVIPIDDQNKGYSPCGKTELAMAATVDTIAANVIGTAITFGLGALAAHSKKMVNRNMVSKILKETDLLTGVRAFAEYPNKLKARHADVIKTAKWDVKLTDKSGFYTGNIDFPSLIQKSGFTPRQSLDVNGNGNEFKIALESRFKNESLHYKVPLSCPDNPKHKSFNLHFSKCPKVIDASPPRKPVSVGVIVKSKDFSDIYPAFSGKDRNISLDFDGSNIRITNNINKYINVLSTTVYYNNVVETSEDKSRNNLLGSIPPQAFTEEKISSLSFLFKSPIKGLANYPEITMAKAKSKTIKFGFAIRYQIGESQQYESFFQTKKYRLADVLLANNR